MTAESRRAHDDAVRSPLGTLLALALAAAICFVPLIPGVERLLGVGVRDVAIAMSGFAVLVVAGAVLYRVAGVGSRAFAIFDRVETVLVQASVLSLVVASQRAASFFWLLWLAHAMITGANQYRRFNLAAFAAMPALVAIAFVALYGDAGAAVLSLVIGALGVYMGWLAAARHARIAELDAERARLAAQLAEVRVRDERERIAREIHDGLGADLAAIDWRLRALRGGGDVGEVITRLGHATGELRSIVWALRVPQRSWGDVVAYVRQRATELGGDRVAIDIIDASEAPCDDLPGELAVDFLRSVLELVRNAVRHAAATRVRVRLVALPGELAAQIDDDGRGLPADALSRDEGGLANIRHRVATAGGRFVAAAGSAQIEVAFPLVRDSDMPIPPPAPSSRSSAAMSSTRT